MSRLIELVAKPDCYLCLFHLIMLFTYSLYFFILFYRCFDYFKIGNYFLLMAYFGEYSACEVISL